MRQASSSADFKLLYDGETITLDSRPDTAKGRPQALGLAQAGGDRLLGAAWFQYFDEAELSAEFGHCLRDLSRARDAADYAGSSVGASSDGRFAPCDCFATMVLADSYLASGELEQAC